MSGEEILAGPGRAASSCGLGPRCTRLDPERRTASPFFFDLELRLAPPGWAQTQVAPKPGLSQEWHLNLAAIPPAQVEKKGPNLIGRPNMLAPLPESIPLNPPSQSMPHTLIMVSLIFSDSRGKGSREVVWWAPSLFLERRQDQ